MEKFVLFTHNLYFCKQILPNCRRRRTNCCISLSAGWQYDFCGNYNDNSSYQDDIGT